MHLDEEQVQRLLHGELPRPVETTARAHLAECAHCRARVAEADQEERDVYALLRHADHETPRISARAVALRARGPGWGRWAAGIAIALGVAGAAYASPGSPLPAWLDAIAEWVAGPSDRSRSAPAPGRPQDPAVAGIAVAPGRELVILFTSPRAGGDVQVSLTDSAEVVVRAPIGSATYTSDAERLVIDNQGSVATFEIQIPRAAPRVEIQVNGDRIFLKEGRRITTDQSTDAKGRYVLPLTPSRSSPPGV